MGRKTATLCKNVQGVFMYARTDWWTIAVLSAVILLVAGCNNEIIEYDAPAHPQRVISLAPAITETIYALELEDLLIGRSRYCVYPQAATELPEVGGLFDPNYELILRLEPDLVIGYPEHEKLREQLQGSGIPFLILTKQTIADIGKNFVQLAEHLGHRDRGVALSNNFNTELEELSNSVSSEDKPSVLVSVGRTTGEQTIREIYAAGETSYFAELVKMAGATYAYSGAAEFPILSSEAIIRLNPDVIIEISAGEDDEKAEQFLAPWQSLEDVSAVRTGSIYLVSAQYTVIPGPRLPLLLERFIAIIHGREQH